MKILALEFSTQRRSVAALDGTASAGGRGWACESVTRETPAFSLIEAALGEAGLDREQVDVIAVGLGPGSATGIRAAIAIAQGWQAVRPVRVFGCSSLEVLATGLVAAGQSGPVQVAVDAQRQEYHVAGYVVDHGGARRIQALRLVDAAAITGLLQAGATVVGAGLGVRFPGVREAWPDAGDLARMALGAREWSAVETLEAIHLRAAAFVKSPPPREGVMEP